MMDGERVLVPCTRRPGQWRSQPCCWLQAPGVGLDIIFIRTAAGLVALGLWVPGEAG